MAKAPYLAVVPVVLALAAPLLALACSSEAGSGGPADAQVPVVAPEGGAETGADAAADAVCEGEAAAIREGLDAERAKQKVQHAVIAVETPRCGARVFLAHDPAASPVGEDAVWRVGSVTKTFVSATVLSLVAEGRLGLDDTLDRFVPSYPNAAAISIRMLLNHTSGAYNYTNAPEFSAALEATPKKVYAPAELLAFATAHAPTFEPGKGYGYSNTNYVLLGLVIEKVTGAKVGAAVRARAIGKAGLVRTFFDGEEAVVGQRVPGYAGKTEVTTQFDPSIAWAAGAIVASPGDLLEWVHTLYGTERVLGAASKKELFTWVPGEGYGLGVSEIPARASLGNGRGVGHGGSIFGFLTQAFWFEDTKVGLVTIVDDGRGDPNALSIVALSALRPK